MSHFIQRKQLQTPLSASYALTASFALNAGGGGAAFPFSGSAVITGSLLVSGSGITVTGSLRAPNITGSLFGTASRAISASWAYDAYQAQAALFAQNAAYSTNAGTAATANSATTADYADNSGIAGFAYSSSQVLINNDLRPFGIVRPFLLPSSRSFNDPAYYTDLGESSLEYNDRNHIIYFRTSSAGRRAQLEIGQLGNNQSGRLIVYGEVWMSGSVILPSSIKFVDVLNTSSFTNLTDLSFKNNSLVLSTGSFSGSFTGSLFGTSSHAISSSRSITASYAETSSITYVTNSNFSLSEIEVADYSNDVAVTFTNGRLKFVFGTPVSQSITAFSFNSTFATDRFNKVLDVYTASATWSNNGYTLIGANIYEDGNLVANTTTGTTLNYNANQSGSRTYVLHVTASSPLDSSIRVVSQSLSGTLSKASPGNPTITPVVSVQLGASSNQIEQGATGSILLFPPGTGSLNGWTHVVNTINPAGPIFVTGSATGSASIIISATSSYSSSGVGGSDNDPPLTTSTFATTTYTKIRSVRYAATTTASFTSTQIENLALWTGSLGATEITGSILKGTVNPNNTQFTVTSNGQYIYIIVDSIYTLTGILNVNNSNSNDLNIYTPTVTGSYKVYRSNNPLSVSILYKLTT